jgi:hypothetical protein
LHARWSLQPGYFHAAADTVARASVAGSLEGDTINFETSLRLAETRTTPLLALSWRPWARHQFSLMHFRVERDGAAALDAELRYAGRTFAAGTTVAGRVTTEALGAEYAYSLLRRPSYELIAGLGAHRVDLQAAISSPSVGVAAERAEFFAPTLAIGGTAVLARRWSAQARWDEIRVDRDEYHGRLRHVSAALQYHATHNLGISLGYRYYAMRLDVDRAYWIGNARTSYRGATLGAVLFF